VRSASDGFSALALIQELVPQVLLSDLNMPGMSGFELLSVVRRVHPAIFVIATSGSFSGKSGPHGIADAFYEKADSSTLVHRLSEPVDPGQLIRELFDLLN
jgi:CheY-like chemotaxis protein